MVLWLEGGSWYDAPRSKDKALRLAKFDRAWLKHQHRGSHHWQHWILLKDSGETVPQYIPEDDCIEMVCDWIGAGLAIHGKREVATWYAQNKETIRLEHWTRLRVRRLIEAEATK